MFIFWNEEVGELSRGKVTGSTVNLKKKEGK